MSRKPESDFCFQLFLPFNLLGNRHLFVAKCLTVMFEEKPKFGLKILSEVSKMIYTPTFAGLNGSPACSTAVVTTEPKAAW